jgi:hypothetical protein
MNMPKYDIRVQVTLEADDMEFDSEADAEAFGWAMVYEAERYHIVVDDIEVIEYEEEEE